MDITDLKRAEEMRAALTRERGLFAQQRASQLAKANEALRGSLDALASVPELDEFIGQVMSDQSVAVLHLADPQALMMPDGLRSYLLGLGIKTLLVIPLTSRGQVNGVLSFRFMEERDFQAEELEIARALATQASLAIQLTELAKTARQSAVLEERNRLAGEIHDSLAHNFAGISMQLSAATEAMQIKSKDALRHLERATDLAQFGLSEARRSALSLRSDIIEESGLIEALKRLVERQISQGCYAVVFVPATCVKRAWRHRSNEISCESVRKRSAMHSATPSQRPSASACDAIRQILCSKSETTVLALLTTGQAGKDSDLPMCGHGRKILAPNWTSAVQPVAAPVSSFVYRSFHEPSLLANLWEAQAIR